MDPEGGPLEIFLNDPPPEWRPLERGRYSLWEAVVTTVTTGGIGIGGGRDSVGPRESYGSRGGGGAAKIAYPPSPTYPRTHPSWIPPGIFQDE